MSRSRRLTPLPPSRPHTRRALGVVVYAVLATALLVLPCLLLARLYRGWTGQSASVAMLAGISLVWSLAIYGVFAAAIFCLRKHMLRTGHSHPPNMFDETIEALDRLANGDYNIHVRKQGHYHYSEIADKINKLAGDLSSMEQLRQEFVSNVSHEIQSPLTSISGFAELLKQEDLPALQRRHYVEVIAAESRRLSKLSDNLLRLSMLDSGQAPPSPAPFRLDKQIQNALLTLEPQWAGKGIEPDLHLSKITYTGDEDLLSQVWINLFHNSIKFTPSGGAISVRLEQEQNQVVCTVSDTGCGIPEENLARIFERFYKVDKARERSLGGNGLGLSLVKRIIDLHGGTVSVTSRPGQGTAFTLTLPVASGESAGP